MSRAKFAPRSVAWFVFSGLLGMALIPAAARETMGGPIPVTVTAISDGDGGSGPSDTVTVVDNMGNNLVPPLTLNETQEAGGVTFLNMIPGFAWNLPQTVFFDEPTGTVSDILTLTNKNNAAFIYFTSDDDNGNIGNPPIEKFQTTIVENADGGRVVLQLQLTPEPASLILAGIPIVVFAGYSFCRRKRTRTPVR
jgi:hypothetical protein